MLCYAIINNTAKFTALCSVSWRAVIGSMTQQLCFGNYQWFLNDRGFSDITVISDWPSGKLNLMNPYHSNNNVQASLPVHEWWLMQLIYKWLLSLMACVWASGRHMTCNSSCILGRSSSPPQVRPAGPRTVNSCLKEVKTTSVYVCRWAGQTQAAVRVPCQQLMYFQYFYVLMCVNTSCMLVAWL